MIELLSDTIDRAAERSPAREAFRCLNNALSYTELVAASNRLAHLLIEQGIRKGDRVGIFMPKCLESAVAVYGILKAGAVYVPIDPNTPTSRMRQIIADCGIQHLTTIPKKQKAIKALLSAATSLQSIIGTELGIDTTVRSCSWDTLQQYPSANAPARQATRQDMAYILYTSGSTGPPKGIIHTHHSGLSYAELSVLTYGIQSHDRIANHSPLHFDISTLGYLSTPFAGATTVLIPEAYTKLPASMSQLMQDEHISIWYSVPYALTQILLNGVTEQRDLKSLRWVLFAGEPFPPKHLGALMRKWSHARFSNIYGPTELNHCTHYHVPSHFDDEVAIPIGSAWDQTEAVVLDGEGRPVSGGETGELLIHSSTMMDGYWNRPDLNQAAFREVRDTTNLTKRFYRTGDLVRLQQDGNYQFLGRKDRQVKIRGHRIELDEIEFSLVSHVDVEEAAVFTIESKDGTTAICAAVTTSAKSNTKAADLTAVLKQSLPWYAVPSQITISKSLPRTATGKIHRRQLQEQASST